MPRPEINDYLFYKIVNEELPDYVYIGSTGCFIKRKYMHKGCCNNPNSKKHNFKIYKTIRENGGWEKWNMVVIDRLDQSTLIDARIREEKLRQEYNGNLNSQKAYTSGEEKKEYLNEYRQANKNIINEKQKKYHLKNKEIIEEKASEKVTCECGSIIRKNNLLRHQKTQTHQNFCKSIELSDA